jgi:hypothetical protein
LRAIADRVAGLDPARGGVRARTRALLDLFREGQPREHILEWARRIRRAEGSQAVDQTGELVVPPAVLAAREEQASGGIRFAPRAKRREGRLVLG